jgi:tetratricopeptide (TPR) repeat protein
VQAGLEQADRFGTTAGPARWLLFERIHVAYWEGRWGDALDLTEECFSELGTTHALSRWNFETRGRIRLARDDVAGALEDAEESLELGRPAKDPQTFFPALSFAALANLEAGRTHIAAELADELLALDPVNHRISVHTGPLFDLPWVLTALGRSEDLLEATERATIRTRWIDAASALASGDYLRAADMYAEMGTRANEAFTRLRAAAQLVDAGRRAQADEQLQRALAFYRSVGATRYIREGEALLAATA